jgi:hypothetical protein
MRDPLRVRISALSRSLYGSVGLLVLAGAAGWCELMAQTPQTPQQSPDAQAAQKEAAAQGADSHPIAIVPLDTATPGHALEVTGDLQVSNGRAVIAANATVVSGGEATHVTLPYRGTLLVCAYTTVKLTADSSAPAGEMPGLMMAMEHGALEMSFAAGRANARNADTLLTPDFRILVSGPEAADVKVRLGPSGDTCIDNPGANGPYVLVSSVFEGGAYRVQPGQRVMFQHGSLHEVVDEEKEPCGCPPAEPKGNEFPLAQSEGLAPLPKAAPSPEDGAPVPTVEPLVYKGADHAPQPVVVPEPAATPAGNAGAAPAQTSAKKKPGFFTRVGRFFKRIFGAE